MYESKWLPPDLDTSRCSSWVEALSLALSWYYERIETCEPLLRPAYEMGLGLAQRAYRDRCTEA